MSIEATLAAIILRNPKVKSLIDQAVADFFDGLTRPQPTKKQSIAVLKKLVEQMEEPEFAEAFVTSEDYFEFLLTVVSAATYLKERPLVLADLYVPGYSFYFPPPSGEPTAVTATNSRVEPDTARAIQVPPDRLYHFYAIPAGAGQTNLLDKLKAGSGNDPASSADINEWRTALSKRVGLAPDDIIPIQGIGRGKLAGRVILIAAQDPTGDSDLKVQPSPTTRASIVKEIESFLSISSF